MATEGRREGRRELTRVAYNTLQHANQNIYPFRSRSEQWPKAMLASEREGLSKALSEGGDRLDHCRNCLRMPDPLDPSNPELCYWIYSTRSQYEGWLNTVQGHTGKKGHQSVQKLLGTKRKLEKIVDTQSTQIVSQSTQIVSLQVVSFDKIQHTAQQLI